MSIAALADVCRPFWQAVTLSRLGMCLELMMSNSRCELQDDRQIPFLIIFHVEAELENTTHGIHVLEPVETYRTSTP